jgi:hypothetical protein
MSFFVVGSDLKGYHVFPLQGPIIHGSIIILKLLVSIRVQA